MAEEEAAQTSNAEPTEPEGAISGEAGAQEATEPTEVKAGVTEPTLETVTKEEHDRVIKTLKDGQKGTVAKMRGDYEKAMAKIAELEAQQQEGAYSALLRGVEDAGGDIDFTKAAIEFDRKARRAYAESQSERQQLESLKEELNEAAMGKVANDMLKTYNLGHEHLDALINEASDKTAVEGRLAMENLALKLSVKAQKAAAVQPTKTDKADGKTAATNLETMSDSEKTGWALDQVMSGR